MADEEIKPVVDSIEINDIPNILEEGIPKDAEYDSYLMQMRPPMGQPVALCDGFSSAVGKSIRSRARQQNSGGFRRVSSM